MELLVSGLLERPCNRTGLQLTGSRNMDISIGDLFTVVGCCVKREVCVQSGKERDAPGYKIAIPACVVLEVCKNILGVVLVLGGASQDTNDEEVADNMNDKD